MNEGSVRRILAKLSVRYMGEPNSSGWMHGECPYAPYLHPKKSDRSRGFAVKVEDKGISAYACPVCGMHGKLSSLARGLAHYREQDYDAIAAEADHLDMISYELPAFDELSVVQRDPEPLDEALYDGVFEDIGKYPEAANFMRSRGVSREVAERLEIAYDPEKRRIVFPVRDGRGRLFGWSGRTILPNHKPKILDYHGLPKRMLILGEHMWEQGKPVILVEGLFAYAHFHQIGVVEQGLANVGALLGSTLTEEKASILKTHGLPTYLLPDPDAAGDVCLWGKPKPDWTIERPSYEGGGAVDQLRWDMPVFVPAYPEHVNDPDFLSLEDVRRMLAETPIYVPDRV